MRAGVYNRVVESGIESVWENVFDWEHLPWLHRESFRGIDLRAAGDWGWHADVDFPGGGVAEIQLIADRGAGRYVSRTASGVGAPGEIWTTLSPLSDQRTAVGVEFFVAPQAADVLEKIGAAFIALYARLWDQDAGMMSVRDATSPTAGARSKNRIDADNLARGAEPTSVFTLTENETLDLGSYEGLLDRLPLFLDFSGERFRLVELEGTVAAHSVTCPHWRGPLGDCEVLNGMVTCPWHGIRFDVRSGRSADGRGLRLRRAPVITRDPETGHLQVVAPSS